MHILKIIHGYPPNYNAGSEVYTQSVANELTKYHKVTVFSREENDYVPDFNFRKESKDSIDFVYVNMARGKDGYNHDILNERFATLIEEKKPDIAHIGHLNHLSTGIVDVLHHSKVPMIYTLHDFWLMCPRGQFLQRNFDGEHLYRLCEKQEHSKCANACYKMYFSDSTGEEYYTQWIEKRMEVSKSLTEKIDLFIAPSKYLMDRFINDFGIPAGKIEYLDYGFPVHYLKPVKTDKKDMFTFGYIGTHIPAKGINLLIDAFSRFDIPAKLKIFGRTNGQSTTALRNMAQKCKNPVEFCGEYLNEDLATVVFNTVDAIVVPSIWGENSPLVIHEAQSCQVPVITANFGGMKEYVEHGVNGLLFEHRNADSLYLQMKYAVDNPKRMIEFGKAGYLRSHDKQVQTIKDHCKLLVKHYKKILDKHGKTI